MIERLADLLAANLHPNDTWPLPSDYRLARVILRAMRDPSDTMLDSTGHRSRTLIEAAIAKIVWTTMIDVALSEIEAAEPISERPRLTAVTGKSDP